VVAVPPSAMMPAPCAEPAAIPNAASRAAYRRHLANKRISTCIVVKGTKEEPSRKCMKGAETDQTR